MDNASTATQPNWMVEVNPSTNATTDYFLNVVNATDTSTAAAPATSPVSGEGVYGAMVADSGGFYVAVFSPTVRDSLSYTASHPGTAKHVVSGLNPGAYFVTQNGVSISDPYPTDASGAIAFAETGGGVIGIGGMGFHEKPAAGVSARHITDLSLRWVELAHTYGRLLPGHCRQVCRCRAVGQSAALHPEMRAQAASWYRRSILTIRRLPDH